MKELLESPDLCNGIATITVNEIMVPALAWMFFFTFGSSNDVTHSFGDNSDICAYNFSDEL